jgi:alpha-galactosidase
MLTRWQKHLSPITPTGWKWTGALPFRIDQEGEALAWRVVASAVDGDVLKENFAAVGCPLSLSMEICRDRSHRSFVLRLTLTHSGRSTSKAFTRLESLNLVWSTAHTPVHLRVAGGGLNEQIYPGNSFRLDTQRFDRNGFVKIEHGWDGRSSNRHLPFMMLCAGESALVSGLEWSGHWYQCGYGREAEALHLDAGVPINRLTLKAGESLTLPPAHAVFSTEDGLAGATNAWRRYLRDCIVPPLGRERMLPALAYNHWFGIGPDIDEALMMRQAQAATALGVEYFILDAGWYNKCSGPNFETGVGNWEVVDRKKFPRGIKPLAEYVRSRGLKFGLWFEPERGHRTSHWVKHHPEWFWDTGAEYLHLNLGLKAAQDGVLQVIGAAIEELSAEWIKIDYNFGPRPYWDKVDKSGKVMFRYMAGLYRVLDELRRRYPCVVFECCASGGRRIDLGQLKRSHTAWISDQVPSSEICRFMQSGANYFIPGSVNSAGISFGLREQGVDRRQRGSLRAYDLASRMLGSLVLFGDVASLPPAGARLVRSAAKAFRSYRHLLDQDFFALLPQPTCDRGWEAVEFCARDSNDAAVFVFSGYEPSESPERAIRLKGLHVDGRYRVSGLLDGKVVEDAAIGSALMTKGLNVRLGPKSFAGFRVQRT